MTGIPVKTAALLTKVNDFRRENIHNSAPDPLPDL